MNLILAQTMKIPWMDKQMFSYRMSRLNDWQKNSILLSHFNKLIFTDWVERIDENHSIENLF